jgi:CheY-like chemotaxis protein
MLKESLEQDGEYVASVAHTGQEALEIASESPFDLAVVDLGIPAVDDLDGEAVARRLRQKQSGLRLMLIPLEGERLPSRLADLDVQGTLPKPFFLPDLPDMLDAALTKPMEAREETRAVPISSPQEIELAAEAVPGGEDHELSAQVIRELEDLAEGINADSVLVTREGEVLASVGRLSQEEVGSLARVVSRGYQLSEQAAEIRGGEPKHFEQSMESDEHMLYALTVIEDVTLSALLPPHATLGFLRHQMKRTARRLRGYMGES